MRQAETSLAYVAVPVSARIAGVAYNPTADTVQMAFPPTGTDPTTWYGAVWSTDSTTTPPTYWALCLVGPGGTVSLDEGDYDAWVQVTDSPEVPQLLSGQLVIF